MDSSTLCYELFRSALLFGVLLIFFSNYFLDLELNLDSLPVGLLLSLLKLNF